MNDYVALHGDRLSIRSLRRRVNDDVVDGHLLRLLHSVDTVLHFIAVLAQAGQKSRLELSGLITRHIAVVKQLRVHELIGVRIHIHRWYHHGHLVLGGAACEVRRLVLVVVWRAHAVGHLLHIVEHGCLLVLQVESVGWLRHFVAVGGGRGLLLSASAVVRVTAASSSTLLLLVLVARHLPDLLLTVGECAIGAVGAALVHLVELALHRFEIVAEALAVLSLPPLIPLPILSVILPAIVALATVAVGFGGGWCWHELRLALRLLIHTGISRH